MEEPMRRAASAALCPLIISDLPEKLKSLVYKFTFAKMFPLTVLLMFCLTLFSVCFGTKFIFQTIVQGQYMETVKENH
jgi:hypothetical protein